MDIPQFVEKKVADRMATGRYTSIDDVFKRAFDALEEYELDEDELCAELQEGIDQLNRGESIPAEEVFASLRELDQEMLKRRQV